MAAVSRLHVFKDEFGKLPDRSDPFAAHPVKKNTAHKRMIRKQGT